MKIHMHRNLINARQCISLQYNRITTIVKAQVESVRGKYNFLFGSSGCWIISGAKFL